MEDEGIISDRERFLDLFPFVGANNVSPKDTRIQDAFRRFFYIGVFSKMVNGHRTASTDAVNGGTE